MSWSQWAGYQANGQWYSTISGTGSATSNALFSNTDPTGPCYGLLARASGTTAGQVSCSITITSVQTALARSFWAGVVFCMANSNPFAQTAHGYLAGLQRIAGAGVNIRYTILKLSSGLCGTTTTLALPAATLGSAGGGNVTVSFAARWIAGAGRLSGVEIQLIGSGALVLSLRDVVNPFVSAATQGLGVIGDSVINLACSATFDDISFDTLSAIS